MARDEGGSGESAVGVWPPDSLLAPYSLLTNHYFTIKLSSTSFASSPPAAASRRSAVRRRAGSVSAFAMLWILASDARSPIRPRASMIAWRTRRSVTRSYRATI